MSITSSTILEDSDQGAFRYVRFEYTFDSGEKVISGPHMLSIGQDATALKNSLIAYHEEQKAEQEANEVLNG